MELARHASFTAVFLGRTTNCAIRPDESSTISGPPHLRGRVQTVSLGLTSLFHQFRGRLQTVPSGLASPSRPFGLKSTMTTRTSLTESISAVQSQIDDANKPTRASQELNTQRILPPIQVTATTDGLIPSIEVSILSNSKTWKSVYIAHFSPVVKEKTSHIPALENVDTSTRDIPPIATTPFGTHPVMTGYPRKLNTSSPT